MFSLVILFIVMGMGDVEGGQVLQGIFGYRFGAPFSLTLQDLGGLGVRELGLEYNYGKSETWGFGVRAGKVNPYYLVFPSPTPYIAGRIYTIVEKEAKDFRKYFQQSQIYIQRELFVSRYRVKGKHLTDWFDISFQNLFALGMKFDFFGFGTEKGIEEKKKQKNACMLGNLIGAGLFIGCMYNYVYNRTEKLVLEEENDTLYLLTGEMRNLEFTLGVEFVFEKRRIGGIYPFFFRTNLSRADKGKSSEKLAPFYSEPFKFYYFHKIGSLWLGGIFEGTEISSGSLSYRTMVFALGLTKSNNFSVRIGYEIEKIRAYIWPYVESPYDDNPLIWRGYSISLTFPIFNRREEK
jgi:hypothetical protein